MLDDDFTCELPDYPINANGGVGGIVEEDEILVCGGYLPDEVLYTDKCFKLAEDKPRNSRQWSIIPDYAEYEYEISTMEPSQSWRWQPAGELEERAGGPQEDTRTQTGGLSHLRLLHHIWSLFLSLRVRIPH